jgi:hypothetical protein
MAEVDGLVSSVMELFGATASQSDKDDVTTWSHAYFHAKTPFVGLNEWPEQSPVIQPFNDDSNYPTPVWSRKSASVPAPVPKRKAVAVNLNPERELKDVG